jgi:hypothetical protein
MLITYSWKFNHFWLCTALTTLNELERDTADNGASYLLIICLDPRIPTICDRIISHSISLKCGFPSTVFDSIFVVLNSFFRHICFGLTQSHESMERWFCKSSDQRMRISPNVGFLIRPTDGYFLGVRPYTAISLSTISSWPTRNRTMDARGCWSIWILLY